MAKTERNPASATVKIDRDLLTKAKQTVSFRGGKLADYLDAILRGPIERDHKREMDKIREPNGEEKS